MNTQEKTYVTASELAETLDISMGKSYKIIRQLNSELAREGFITVAGKCPRRYLEKKWYGYGVSEKAVKEE
ncbi:hypothetical protein [Acetivibrio ethanolgignens]|uniref:ICEBs1 excisionase n=1 Tax=Acetivibrio ethanolgignens TaxID=290052 RepID=A0A0V8QIK5_9FIRM|nr:hypothetical protein [Acetivibrio ethanolgignens]KSV60234.1 ICEBs1 excisionase [Acetivibrio ethanolgignens]